MSADLTFRLADRTDDAAIAALIKASFPDNPKQEAQVLAWQYSPPLGPALQVVAEDGGQIVAHWAALPLDGILDGRPSVLGRSADGVVLTSHRGQGLWIRLAKELYAQCHAAGIPVVLSYPNAKSLRGLEHAGWQPIGAMHAHALVTSPGYVAQRLHLPSSAVAAGARALFRTPSTSLTTRIIQGTPDDVDRLWGEVAPHVRNGLVRDERWYDWRYCRPDKHYHWYEARTAGQLVALAVVGIRAIGGGQFADVLELVTSHPHGAPALVAAIRGHLGAEVDGLTLAALAGSRLADDARSAGFRRIPDLLSPQELHAGLAATGPATARAHNATWSLQWGDSDHL